MVGIVGEGVLPSPLLVQKWLEPKEQLHRARQNNFIFSRQEPARPWFPWQHHETQGYWH